LSNTPQWLQPAANAAANRSPRATTAIARAAQCWG
jgi:hypothetical protein